jgi:hypothetical protein
MVIIKMVKDNKCQRAGGERVRREITAVTKTKS